jgi:hypothetical protein
MRGTFIYRFLRRLAWSLLPEAGKRAILCFEILAFDYGHWKSVKDNESVDARGMALPWLTYPALDFLRRWPLKGRIVFEYGSGNSTRFWLNSGASVCGVESDPEWHARVRAQTNGEPLELILESNAGVYPIVIEKFKHKFDIVLIDGIERMACARKAIKKVRSDGVIILDNSDWYPNTSALLRARGFFQVDFTGFTPMNHYTSTTSFFFAKSFRQYADNASWQGLGVIQDVAD